MKEQGWNIELNKKIDNLLPKAIADRYMNIPELWQEFIGKVRCMVNTDETIWFLGTDDFSFQSDQAFRWNEWELISLESAEGDTEWCNEVKQFWDEHLPIVMSVRTGYSYYAIFIRDGSVVKGSEPEFEECEVAADSFKTFIESILNGGLQL